METRLAANTLLEEGCGVTEKEKGREPTDEEYIHSDILSEQARFDRLPSNEAIKLALTVLHDELSLAAQNYKMTDLQRQRDAIVKSSYSVQRFLSSCGFHHSIGQPLIRPAQALIEREHNRLDPLFCERKRSGKPSRSLEDYERIGAIAALSEAWLELHQTQDLKVPQKLQRLIRQISGPWFGDLSLSRVTAAREMVSGEGKDHFAVKWAAQYRAIIESDKTWEGLEAAINNVARTLNEDGGR
jgi:hypothetical protein